MVTEGSATTTPTASAEEGTCCEPVLGTLLGEDDAAALAAGFKLLADPVRLRLFNLIATASSGEVCACDLADPVGRSQPTVSHHLSLLVDGGFLEREQRGRWAWYRAVPTRIANLRAALTPPA